MNPIQITVSGKSLKECHDQILKMADEIDQGSQAVATPSEPTNKTVLFPLKPEVTPAAPAAPGTPVPTGDVDSTGAVWDPSIHSSSKAKNTNGTWKARRNAAKKETTERKVGPFGSMTDDQYNQVVSKSNEQTAAAMPTTQHAVGLPAEQAVTVAPENVPTFPPSAPPPAMGVNKLAHTFDSFKANITDIMIELPKVRPDVFTQEYSQRLNAYFGKSGPWEWSSDDAKMQELFQNFTQAGYITRLG